MVRLIVFVGHPFYRFMLVSLTFLIVFKLKHHLLLVARLIIVAVSVKHDLTWLVKTGLLAQMHGGRVAEGAVRMSQQVLELLSTHFLRVKLLIFCINGAKYVIILGALSQSLIIRVVIPLLDHTENILKFH